MARTPDPTRVVADETVLVADLFVDGDARAALDVVRAHSWFELHASVPLITRATRAVADLGDRALADAWRTRIESEATVVDHPSGDHPALATAYAARTGHLLTYDDRLRSADTGIAMRQAMPLSVRAPDAFLATVDPATLYEVAVGGDYAGPDVDSRS